MGGEEDVSEREGDADNGDEGELGLKRRNRGGKGHGSRRRRKRKLRIMTSKMRTERPYSRTTKTRVAACTRTRQWNELSRKDLAERASKRHTDRQTNQQNNTTNRILWNRST